MKPRAEQSGFVLLIVLLVVTLCAVVLGAAARRSGQSALRARGALRSLQFDWGAASCRNAMMHRAEKFIEEQRKPDAPPPGQGRATVQLGGTMFHLLVADETAKASANALARERRDYGLALAAARLQTDGRKPLTVELRPQLLPSPGTRPADSADKAPADRFSTFDQLFVIHGPADLVGPTDEQTSMACRRVTFWNQGPVNIRRAEVPVMREMLAGVLSESDLSSIADLRLNEADVSIIQILANLRLPKDRGEKLRALVTDQSKCHSLWVMGENRHIMSYRLYVEQLSGDVKKQRNWTFTWLP